MQATRQQILEILKHRGQATVEEIVHDLEQIRGSITAVTVRHHLSKLQHDGLIEIPEMLHRSTPGRPQYIYSLSSQGMTHFPNNYQQLASNLLDQMRQNLPDSQVNVIIEGIADTMADEARLPHGTVEERLDSVVTYLTAHGYEAHWEPHAEGYVLCMSNCPYHQLAQHDDALCKIDMRLIAKALGVVPRMISHVAEGQEACSYLIPDKRDS